MIKFSYNLDPAGNVALQKDENTAIDVNVKYVKIQPSSAQMERGTIETGG